MSIRASKRGSPSRAPPEIDEANGIGLYCPKKNSARAVAMRIGAPLGLVVVKPVAANGFAGSAVMKSRRLGGTWRQALDRLYRLTGEFGALTS